LAALDEANPDTENSRKLNLAVKRRKYPLQHKLSKLFGLGEKQIGTQIPTTGKDGGV
jgi:hypothetical protein